MQHFHRIIIFNCGLILFFAFAFAYFFYNQSKQKAKNTIYAKTQKLLVTQRDMTHKLTLANKVLDANEEKLSLTLNSIGHAVISTDVFARVTRINAVAEKLTGWTSAAAFNKPIDEICNFVNATSLEPLVSTVFETIAQAKPNTLPKNTLLISKNNEQYYIEDTCAPIINAHNTLQGAVLVFHDVSEQQLIVKKLTKSEALYKATLTMHRLVLRTLRPMGSF